MRTVKVELTPKFLVYAFVSLLILLGAWEIREVLISLLAMLFVAFIFSAGFRPLIAGIQRLKPFFFLKYLTDLVLKLVSSRTDSKKTKARVYGVIDYVAGIRIGRPLAVAIIYAGLFLFVVSIILILTNEFVNQINSLVDALPGILDRLIDFARLNIPILEQVVPFQQLQLELGQFVADFASSEELRTVINGENLLIILNQTLGVFSSAAELLISVVTVIILSVYMLMRKDPVYEDLLTLIPEEQGRSFRNVFHKVETSLGSWMVGQFSLMVIIGVVTYFIVLIPSFFDPNYRLDEFAFPIALLAGLLEAIPNIGPTITLILASLLALGTSGLPVVVYITLAFLILQNLEGVFIVPMVMKRAVGLDPIVSILGIIAGFQIGGVVGAILAIPLIGILQIIVIGVSDEYKRSHSRKPRKLL